MLSIQKEKKKIQKAEDEINAGATK